MRYRVTMSVAIEAVDDRQAHECAVKLSKLLKSPLVKMAVEGEGIRLSGGDGNPIVHQPLPERAMRA
jgi:hypothetical protein